jgi:hypothetical protein
MKNDKWFYEAQRLFKEWKSKNGKTSETAKQVITTYTYEEHVIMFPKDGGRPEAFVLYAYKNTGEVYLLPDGGKPVRIFLRKRNQD